MATFHIEHFGCRATQADAAAIERQLLERGYTPAQSDAADVVVVNTCTVTAAADAQARQAIRATHRHNPAARIVATGCYAQRAPEELAELEGVAWVVGNSHKPEIPRLLDKMTAQNTAQGGAGFVPLAALGTDPMPLARGPAKILTGNIFEQTTVLVAPVEGGERGHTRPVLKVQDGCSNRCAYCVIPFVRGRSRSLPPGQAIEEIRRLARARCREVVLSGINLGSYGRDLIPRIELGELVRRILDETPLERLRLSSIEPMDVTRELIELVASTARIARHFHIPLQSGSDRVLAAMHRWYRVAHYARRIEMIRETLPDAGIGADVMAGFAGEKENDHRETLQLIERLPFTYLHVFPFSKRPGTRAAELPNELPAPVIQRRARDLRALAAEKKAAFLARQIGSRIRVLTLDRSGNGPEGAWTEAITGNYLEVRLAGAWLANQMLDVRIVATEDTHLLGLPAMACEA